MSININSISEAHNAYIKGNISVEERAAIRERWAANIDKWDAEMAAAKDENKYEITDDEAKTAKNDGKQKASEKTGHDGKADTAKSVASGLGTYVAAGGGAAAAANAAGLIANVLKYKGADGCADKTVTGAAILAVVGTASYGVSRAIRMANPNGEEAEALQEMKDSVLPDANSELGEAQEQMEDAAAEIQETTDETNNLKEDANSEIETTKAEFDMYRDSAVILQEKSRRGEKLTSGEKEFLKEATPILESLGGTIGAIQEETEVVVQEAGSTIEGLEGEFDDAASTIENVKGTTEFSAQFDEKTVDNAEWVADSAEMGALSGKGIAAGGVAAAAVGAIKLGSIFTVSQGIAMIAFGGVATATGLGAADQYGKLNQEQNMYKNIALEEIEVRQNTEDFTEDVSGVYDEGIEFYDESLDLVNNEMILEMPDDLEVPEEGLQVQEENPQATKTESPAQSQETDKKGEDDDKKVNKKEEHK